MNSKSTCDFTLFQLNCQSVKGKATQGIITDLFAEYDIDIFALTETWFADDESDEFYSSLITPPGYDIYSIPRGHGDPHGGVAVIYKSGIKIVSKSHNKDRRYKSFEFCDIVFTSESKCVTLVSALSIAHKPAYNWSVL